MSQKGAEATKREDRKSSREPESGEVESQRSGGLFDERRSFRRERARRWCDADQGRKIKADTPMLLAGLTTTAVRSKKTARTLADTKLEMEIIS